ncbi:L,D-transpeptidase family protein [Shewanella pealeana]|uniref:Peptidoglycan-binding domain 1 protein n=1 Tax=Shewanella pealeana (strain ATCC 700345 / ANG-SQ1) TaxID=398579 RepID=A8H441_SHEPA|nr:L,D-transpeptidase family protein [Shewanella pealeana]ABV87328.1 Peptidoglycan-binding domain 1 protein [Shewanella pealeana ATCC 700345]
MKRVKAFWCQLLVRLLIVSFSAVVHADIAPRVSLDNQSVAMQLSSLAFDLGVIDSAAESTNTVGLVKLLNKELFQVEFTSLSLSTEQYLKLIKRKDIASYRRLIKQYKALDRFQWPMINPIELRLGLRVKEVAKLRWVLVKLGDMEPHTIAAYRESIYDPSVEAGLKRFQIRHGLSVDGKLGNQTLLSINTKPSFRVVQLQKALKLSLKKFDEEQEYVFVNLTDYTLRISKNGVEQLKMPVIVGKPSSKTPELNTVVSVVTINPTWTPPASIIYQDIMKSVDEHPNYLRNNNFVLKSYKTGIEDSNLAGMDTAILKHKLKTSTLVQRSGDKNALGKFRFTIPNTSAIFLHDTPNKYLFKRANRALSHGCIRLSEPERFAHYLISKEPLQTQHLFQKALKTNKTMHFRLRSRLPINIIYQNVWIDKDGRLQIRES